MPEPTYEQLQLRIQEQEALISELRQSEQRYQSIFAAVDAGACLFERMPPRGDGLRDYRYIAMNPAMQAMFGISDLSGRSIRDNFPDEAEDWYDDYDRVLETGQSVRFQRGSVRQGMVLEMFVARVEDGSGKRLLAVMEDVTARVLAEEQLAESERIAGLGVWEYVVATEETLWSEGVRRICGIDPNEPSPDYGRMLRESIHPDDAELLDRTFREAKERCKPYELEHRIVRPDGTVRYVQDLGQPHFDQAGALVRYVGTTLDVTERKRAEEALRVLTQNIEMRVVERTSQLTAAATAKSEFLAHMSHEIRAPMNAVINIAQLLQDEALTPEQNQLVSTINEAGQSLLRIINDILDFSNIDAGQLQLEQRPFELAALLSRIDSLLRGAAEAKGLRFAITSPSGTFRLLAGDTLRLEQVLVNLINNAIKFTRQGSITLTVVPQAETATGVRLRFEVCDTGIGIAADATATLFQPFAQADSGVTRRFGGTGLGLAICRRVVDLMGGEIGVTSTPDEGSTFWFELPFTWATDAMRAAALAKGPQRTGPRLAGLRVLAVDDSQMNLVVVDRILKSEGATTVFAADGQQALRILQADPQAFDVVLIRSSPRRRGHFPCGLNELR